MSKSLVILNLIFFFYCFQCQAQFLELSFANENIPQDIEKSLAKDSADFRSAIKEENLEKFKKYMKGPYLKEMSAERAFKFLVQYSNVSMGSFFRVYFKKNFPEKNEFFIPFVKNNSFGINIQNNTVGFVDYFAEFFHFKDRVYNGVIGFVWQNTGLGWKLYGLDRGRIGMFEKNRDYWIGELERLSREKNKFPLYLTLEMAKEIEKPFIFLRFFDRYSSEIGHIKDVLKREYPLPDFPFILSEYNDTIVTNIGPLFYDDEKKGVYAEIKYVSKLPLAVRNLPNLMSEGKNLRLILEKYIPGIGQYRDEVFFRASRPDKKGNDISYPISNKKIVTRNKVRNQQTLHVQN